jgi:spiro-SPASM protein
MPLKTCAVLYLEDGLGDDALSFMGRFLPDGIGSSLEGKAVVEAVWFSVPAAYSGRLSGRERCLVRTEKDDITNWKRACTETGAEHIVKIFADSPFLETAIIRDMLDFHLKYAAEYTFSENLPAGFACEIISASLVDAIPASGQKMVPLGEVIRSNINQFDVELYYREPDMRDKRLSFRTSSPRDRLIMERIAARKGGVPAYGEVLDVIRGNPDVLYVGPSYVEIELCGRCDLDCIFCFRKHLKSAHGDMNIDTLRALLDGMRAFNLPYAACLGGSGEPLMHGRFYNAAEMLLGEGLLKTLVVETNGVLANGNFKGFCSGAGKGRIRVIVNVNGHDETSYAALHGAGGFDLVAKNVLALRDTLGERDSLYVQIMKINETEPFLDRYYDFWEKQGVGIILQKQNTWLGRISDRRYSDLTPLERVPCWHLQRDFTVLWDGTVAFCKQDVDGEFGPGRIPGKSVREIWDGAMQRFLSDYRASFPPAPDCKVCDEWYTFNL